MIFVCGVLVGVVVGVVIVFSMMIAIGKRMSRTEERTGTPLPENVVRLPRR